MCYIQIAVFFNLPAIAGRHLKRQKRGNLTPETLNVHNIKSCGNLAHTILVYTMEKINRAIFTVVVEAAVYKNINQSFFIILIKIKRKLF